jgi:endonuclease/exonuclease/phosphatase (EEP) superfamily protein YafD
VLEILSVVFILVPFLPLTGNNHWTIRMWDFIRPQTLVVQFVLFLFLLYQMDSVIKIILLLGLTGSIVYQVFLIVPFTILYPRQQLGTHSPYKQFTIIAANVYQDNARFDDLLKLVHHKKPDVLLTMETHHPWEKGLESLEKEYEYTVKVPLDNYYGMHLYSKKPLVHTEVKYLVNDDIPSIYVKVDLGEDEFINLLCLHPEPPSPTERETSKNRDAELMLAGKWVRELTGPVIVCGDLNDVAWSRTTTLFKKMTGLIDPRIGRGFYPTFHAEYFFMRFPLDHFFHSKDLILGEMTRLPYFGSDHFAMFYSAFSILHEKEIPNPKITQEEKEEINQYIELADVNTPIRKDHF